MNVPKEIIEIVEGELTNPFYARSYPTEDEIGKMRDDLLLHIDRYKTRKKMYHDHQKYLARINKWIDEQIVVD